jgi:hypothetical protein
MIKLIISETASSSWNYHLRLVDEGQEKYGGGAEEALCGEKLGWDTKVPLKVYGIVSHLKEHWCKKCLEIARKTNLPGVEKIR